MGEDNTKDMTSNQVDMNRNPTGKGGFGDNPQNRSDGRWNPDMTFSFQYKKFMNMEVDEFKKWKEENPKRTMVQELAWNAVLSARNGNRNDRLEIANRTEGMPKQSIDATTNGKEITVPSIQYIIPNDNNSKD